MTEPETTDSDAKKACAVCSSTIARSADKCPECQSYQSAVRRFASFWVQFIVPGLSLFVAILAITPLVLEKTRDYLAPDGPQFRLLSFFSNNVADPSGRLLVGEPFSISAQFINFGKDRIIIDESLHCEAREPLSAASETTRQTKTVNIEKIPEGTLLAAPIVVPPLYQSYFDFRIYLEREGNEVIEPGETRTVTWSTDTAEPVEYLEPSSLEDWDRETSTFTTLQSRMFYQKILDDISTVLKSGPVVRFPRGKLTDEQGNLEGFFLNIDCDVSVSDLPADGLSYFRAEELHLELLYESRGSNGVFPRWRLGKNIGGGFGNGFGNGAGGERDACGPMALTC